MRTKCLILFMLIIYLSCQRNDDPLTNNNELDYFPLQVGNTWTYELSTSDPKNELNGKTLTLSTVGTKSFDGKTYFVFQSDIPSIESPWDSALFRVSNQQIFRRINGKDYLWYDFGAQKDQSWEVSIRGLSVPVTLESKDHQLTVPVGSFVNSYSFHFFEGFDAQWVEYFTPQVGLVNVSYATLVGLSCRLQKAKVNDVSYP